MSIHYLETGSTDPCYNLALEQYVLEHRREGDWLMLWQNANTVVIGLNQNTAEEINASFVEEHGITVVRRMTGGGAVYHDLGNLAGRWPLWVFRLPPAGAMTFWSTGKKSPV